MNSISLRSLSLVGLIICAVSLAGAHYIEYNFSVSPCPMCELQRGVFWVLGAVFLFGSLVKLSKLWGWIYIGFAELIALVGLFIAGRQFWLQYLAPPQHLSCSASLGRLIDAYPFLDALKIVLQGSTDCASIDFTILGTSIAGWSVILFGFFCILMPYLYYVQTKR